MPLHILLTVMREHWEDRRDVKSAVALARAAAPYVHARASGGRPAEDLAGVPDDELDSWSGGGGGEEAAAADPE